MRTLVEKVEKGETILDSDLIIELYEICDREHYCCSIKCPIFRLNGLSPVRPDRPFEENRGCDCYKDGSAMLEFIRNH